MKEPVVTIKLTESELKLVSESLDLCIHELPQHEDNEDDDEKTPARLTLLKQLHDIEEWIDEEKTKAVIDKRISEESTDEQTKSETTQRVCVPCDD